MKWNEHQRAERARRLLVVAAEVATEGARMLYDCPSYRKLSADVNLLASHLQVHADEVRRVRRSIGGDELIEIPD